ncbi:MAG: hypothetical protein KF784_04490 [Fimbriimonadaceae bacterium]|nr:hypothetical protein [Fimbriimonadaceae bacterium]
MKPRNPDKPKLTRTDYYFLIGGPVAFIAFAILGILWILGPPPRQNPIKLIKDGEVRVGMSIGQVEDVLGRPKEISELPDGGLRYLYVRNADTAFVADEGIVEFSPTGQVTRVATDQFNAVPPDQR